MHSVHKQLVDDHIHISRLLRFLSTQVGYAELKANWDDQLSLVLDSLDYIQSYPEKWHHPVEDIVFARLREKGACDPKLLQDIADEHAKLERGTRELQQLFEAVANDYVISGDRLAESLRQFIDAQSAHLARENDRVYPLLEEHLTSDDWDDIANQVELITDPLFGQAVQEDYQYLFRHLLSDTRNNANSVPQG